MKLPTASLQILLGAILTLGVFTQQADAVVVAYYDFSGTLASTDADSNTTATNITVGSGQTGGLSGSNDHFFMRPVANSTEAFAFSANAYYTFTLTPSAGAISYTSLNFDYRLDASGGEFFALYASPTGTFVSGANVATGALTVTPTLLNYNIDLSGIASLQDVSTPMTFRMYVWGAVGGTDVTRFDNITLNATPVPETNIAGLMGLAGLGLFAIRRRR